MPEFLPQSGSTTYSVQISHQHASGIVASPVASQGPANASLVRWHAPFEVMSVYWTVVCEGKPPMVPSHKGYWQNGNRLFLGGERVGVITPNIIGHIFHASGRLDFQVMSAEGLDSAFDLGKCPWEIMDPREFYIPAEYFLDGGILNPTWRQPKGIAPDPNVQILNLQSAIAP